MSRPRSALLALLGLLGCGLIALRPTTDRPATPAAPPPADPEDRPRPLDLSSDDLPDPVPYRDGEVEWGVTRFRLVVPALTRRGGVGILALGTDTPAFNDYGDARGGWPPTAVVPVTLYGWEDTSLDGTLYEVRLPDPRAAGRLWLFLVAEPADEHRLIAWPPGKGRRTDPSKWPRWGEGNPERVLVLRPPSLPPDPLPAARAETRPRLSGLVHNPAPAPGRREPDPQQVRVTGDPAAGGHLDLDPNYLFLGPDGRVGGSTLIGRSAIPVVFRPVGPDPLGYGRQAFELVPTDAGRVWYDGHADRSGGRRTYVVVYGAGARGPHRLVVKEGDVVRQVVPLTDFDRETRLGPIRSRNRLPPRERAAVDALAALCGPGFSFRAAGRHVWTVAVSGDATRLDPVLAGLPQLADLDYERAVLPPAGLTCLGRLPELRSVRIVGDISDDGLASLAAAPNLTSVQVRATAGLTLRGLVHLARLPKVAVLDVGLPDPVLDPPAADEALRTLAAAPAVEQLHIWNVRPAALPGPVAQRPTHPGQPPPP